MRERPLCLSFPFLLPLGGLDSPSSLVFGFHRPLSCRESLEVGSVLASSPLFGGIWLERKSKLFSGVERFERELWEVIRFNTSLWASVAKTSVNISQVLFS